MWTRRVYGNSAGSQIRLCFLISTKVMFKNWTYKSLYWVHLLCNNFNRLLLRNSAITTAWVMRQSSDNEKLEEQKKTFMLAGKIWNVQPLLFSIWSVIRSSSYESDQTYKKVPKLSVSFTRPCRPFILLPQNIEFFNSYLFD